MTDKRNALFIRPRCEHPVEARHQRTSRVRAGRQGQNQYYLVGVGSRSGGGGELPADAHGQYERIRARYALQTER